VATHEIPARVGQAVESLETVPLLANALAQAGLDAPVTTALARLIEGGLPLPDWIAVVRTAVPPPARWRPAVRPGFWSRVRSRFFGPRGGSPGQAE
jgi:glycerol-3-phosphate dehydrogenase (NAD(P)+)